MTYQNCLRLEKKYKEEGNLKEAEFWKARAIRKAKRLGIDLTLPSPKEETKSKEKK